MVVLVTGLWGMSFYSSPAYSGYKQPANVSIEASNLIPQSPSHLEIAAPEEINLKVKKEFHLLLGINVTQRTLGMACASINGITAGTMFVPLFGANRGGNATSAQETPLFGGAEREQQQTSQRGTFSPVNDAQR